MQHQASRVTHGFYMIMGIEDCTATSAAEYANIAVRFGLVLQLILIHPKGTEPHTRELVSKRLLERSPLLLNRQGANAEWATLLQQIALRQEVTNIHESRPTSAIPWPYGDPLPKL
jgi:hypothetical protein